ncbi:MAG: STAS/SEC14 domain-containing protein [Hymenobacteraceae bacterium]|nr:STAS/SEC14 domain-containing protein [Hymenobacteraceae bacterium]
MSQEFLTLRFSPSGKYLSAKWQRPVSSEEYRQGIRMIAFCIATLKVQLASIDFRKTGAPSLKDQCCTAEFLRQALKNTDLRRSARVLSGQDAHWQAYRQIMEEAGTLPYQAKAFSSPDQAQSWLFEGQEGCPPVAESFIDIPLSHSATDLRKLLRNSTLPDSEAGTGSAESEAKTAPANHILCSTDFVEINLHEQARLLSVRWLRPVKSHEYRHGITEAGCALLRHGAERLLVNNQRISLPTLDDQRWLTDTCSRVLSRSRLQQLAVVYSSNIMQQMTSEALDAKLKATNLSYQTQFFLTEEEAMEWLMMPKEALQLHHQRR